ncbi:MAG: 30S ribosomal protein S16 [Mycoplasma sp.]|nr:30S ribosomal protein S16 [Mycoplasma sp.]
MVKIRMRRIGKKFNPIYQIVVADERFPRDGRFIEKIGFYNPVSKELKVNQELREKWIKVGAKPSETVRNLFKSLDKKIQS